MNVPIADTMMIMTIMMMMMMMIIIIVGIFHGTSTYACYEATPLAAMVTAY